MITEVLSSRIMSSMIEEDIALYCYLPAGPNARIENQGIIYDAEGNETEEVKRIHKLPENWSVTI